MGKNLVTGGSGFIGSHLVEALIERGHKVKVFDLVHPSKAKNLRHILNNPNLEYIEGDITSSEQVKEVVTSDLDVIYHLSAIVGVKKYIDNPLLVIDVNVIGTKNVVEAASRNSTKVIFASTSEIYGNNPEIPWSEEGSRLLGPTTVDRWSYSTSKAVGEHMLLGMHKYRDLPISIVRFFNVYGPRQEPILVISQSVQRVLNGQKPLIYDDGKQTRCFTYVKDAVEAIIQISESESCNGEIYNIGSDIESTIEKALVTICSVSGVESSFEKIDTQEHYGKSYEDIIRRVPNVSKIFNDLGWKATTSLEQGIKKTIEWSRANKWWYD